VFVRLDVGRELPAAASSFAQEERNYADGGEGNREQDENRPAEGLPQSGALRRLERRAAHAALR
jgi:hypothetical protein